MSKGIVINASHVSRSDVISRISDSLCMGPPIVSTQRDRLAIKPRLVSDGSRFHGCRQATRIYYASCLAG